MRSILRKKNGPTPRWVIFCFFLLPVLTHAQEEEKFIGEVRLMNVVEAECTFRGDLYEIRFRDVKKRRFPKYASFHFKGRENYFKLKNRVLKGFDNIPEEPQLLDFTEEQVELEFTKSPGMESFRFVMISSKKNKRTYSSWFSNGKAEKLFGI